MILTDAAAKKKYWVHFYHSDVDQTDPMYRLSDRMTMAAIHEGPCKLRERPCGTQSFMGVSYCSRVDSFDFNTGRKKALLNAMIGPDADHPWIPKDIRERLWTSYFVDHRARYEPYRDPRLKKKSSQRQTGPP
jgi:hypothetical protein